VSLLEEFENRYQVQPAEPAKKILFVVMSDLLGRKGFDNEWDGIDDEIREEILSENLGNIQKNLS
jgi:hypothetical protein